MSEAENNARSALQRLKHKNLEPLDKTKLKALKNTINGEPGSMATRTVNTVLRTSSADLLQELEDMGSDLKATGALALLSECHLALRQFHDIQQA